MLLLPNQLRRLSYGWWSSKSFMATLDYMRVRTAYMCVRAQVLFCVGVDDLL